MSSNPATVTSKEAAEILGVSQSRIRQLVTADQLTPSGTFGRAMVLKRRDVVALAKLRAKQAKAEAKKKAPKAY